MTLLDFWPTPEAVTRCIPSEAEVISDATFLAVHQPMRLSRRSLTNPNAPPEATDERALLAALLNQNLPQGYVIVPIVGPSGVGKSHLIRWLGLHLGGDRHVISIPKSTSLRRILESILQGLEGPGYDEIRSRLGTAREKIDDIAAEEKLLAEFRIALRRRTDEARAVCDAAQKRGEKPPAGLRAIAETHGEGLIALLEGPTKEALLRDTPGRGSVFRPLMRRVTTGIIDAEQGEFTAADFEFAAVHPGKLPELRLQKYVQKLKSNVMGDRQTAAAIMNEIRDGAVGQLLGLGENQIADLFRGVREELFKDGRELVLLIEDFVTLAGVQRGLLDVIKMEGVRAGEAERCVLRTALAVTSDFLSPYDTLKTRVRTEFVLEERPAAEAELLETITDMVGAYLNAARLGRERLESWFDSTHHNPDARPPSFQRAEQELSDADRAALEAFDTSTRDGYSLFPFNRAAIKRLAFQHLAAGDSLRLNPRDLITEVLHGTLLYHRDAFARGEFPPEDFHRFNPNDLGIDVTAWLANLHKADHRRYAVLLGYWGDRPRQQAHVRLPAAVYRAFGLSPLTDAPSDPKPVHGDEPRPDTKRKPEPESQPRGPETKPDKAEAEISARMQALDGWATHKKLSQREAASLRNDLLNMIDAAIDWDAELLAGPRDLSARTVKGRPAEEEGDALDAEEFDTTDSSAVGAKFPRAPLRTAVGPNWIFLPFSPTNMNTAPDDAMFTLCREEVFGDTVALTAVRLELRALIRFHVHKSFDYDGGDEDRVWYSRLAERAARQATKFLRRRYERVPDNDAATEAVTQALYVSARVLDLNGSHGAGDADVLSAVLHPGPKPSEFPAAAVDPWQAFRRACAVDRIVARDFLLRRLAARQGGGAVLYGIDAARLLAALGLVRKSSRVASAFPGNPQNLDENARQVRNFVAELGASRMDAAVNSRRAALERWAADTRAWLGSPFDKRAFVAECRELMTQARNLGVFRADVEYETLRGHAKEFEEAAVTEAIDAVDRLKQDAAPGVVLTALVQAPDEALRRADTFRQGFQSFADQTLRLALERIGQALKLAGAVSGTDPDALLLGEGRKLDDDLKALIAAAGEMPDDAPPPAPDASRDGSPGAEAQAPSRFAAVREALDRFSRLDRVAQQLKELEPIRSKVNGWAIELPALVARQALYEARNDVAIDEPPDGQKLRNAVAAARAKVATSPLEITRGRTFTNLEAAATNLLNGYQSTISNAWDAWVQRQVPKLADAELAPFEMQPEYQATVREIRDKMRALQRAGRTPADSVAGFVVVEETAALVREQIGQLPVEAPEEVKGFLTATNSKEGAPLGMLTPTVVDWLRAKGLFEKYRIRR